MKCHTCKLMLKIPTELAADNIVCVSTNSSPAQPTAETGNQLINWQFCRRSTEEAQMAATARQETENKLFLMINL